MYISETTFPHLNAEADARLARELERRRVIAERLAEGDGSATGAVRTGRRGWWHRSAVAARPARTATA